MNANFQLFDDQSNIDDWIFGYLDTEENLEDCIEL